MPLPLGTEDIAASLNRLPAFPPVNQRLLEALRDDNAGMAALAELIEHDPVMTGSVLSAANRMLRQNGWPEVWNVFSAASIVGFDRIRDLSLIAGLKNFSGSLHRQFAYWRHSLAAGVCAQELALKTGVDSGHALIVGLLHDIGHIWLCHFYPLEFQRTQLRVAAFDEPMKEVERRMLGLDHCEIGSEIIRIWKLPEDIAEAIRYHHEPTESAAKNSLVAIAHLAEIIVNALDVPFRENNRANSPSVIACRTLGLEWKEEALDLFGSVEARYYYMEALLS